MFHKEGFFIIVFTFLFTAGIAIGSDYFISIEWLKLAIQIIALGFLIIVLQFFRNPRRIVNYAQEGQEVVQGTDAGFIKFGSRIDLYLPIGTKIDVELNQVVKGGIDIVASK